MESGQSRAKQARSSHCQWHPNFTPALEAYLDKFLLGKKDGASTDILRSKFTEVDRKGSNGSGLNIGIS